jgi:hypothetical protein
MSTNENAHGQVGAVGASHETQQGEFSTLSPIPVNEIPRVRSPRRIRGLRRLLSGEVCREELDRVTGSSSSPDIVFHLRHRYGFKIKCQMRPAIDRDGRICDAGWYSMTDEHSRQMARAVLARDAAKGGG